MYCSHCGASIPDGGKFCSSCGAPVNGYEHANIVNQPASNISPSEGREFDTNSTFMPPNNKKQAPHKKWGVWYALGIIVFFFLAGLVIIHNNLFGLETGTGALFSSNEGGKSGKSAKNPIEIRPLNYLFREDEDGWNIGFVRMYLINTSDEPLFSYSFTLQDATIETAEGKTYPVDLYTFYRADIENYLGDPYTMNGGINKLGWPQNVSVGSNFPLLPGFPVIPYASGNDTNYVFLFRFAKAANPIKIELSTSVGPVTFDLNKVEKTMPAPNPKSEPLSNFADLVDQDSETANFTMSNYCTIDRNCKASITYSLANKNKFDNLHFSIPGGYAVYYADGTTRNWPDWSIVDTTVGPDQTVYETFDFSEFAGCDPKYLIYYESTSSVKVYDLACTS